MSKQDNLTDFLTDVADAIREMKGTTEKINPQNFADEIKSLKKSPWTGHADVEGLKAIGWDDDDIAYYQEHGVNWMEEDDEYHKVSDDNKALYGVLTVDNYKDYKDYIVYLPKFNLSSHNGIEIFRDFTKMVGLPLLELPNIVSLQSAFYNCNVLPYIIPINTSNVTSFQYSFRQCYNLSYIPKMDASKAENFNRAFEYTSSLETLPFNSIESATNMESMNSSSGIKYLTVIDCSKASISGILNYCYNLHDCKLIGLSVSLKISWSYPISKDSILYIIKNESATEPITITIHKAIYKRLSTDPDIVAALENHPLVELGEA